MSVADQPAALAHRGFSLDGHENTLRAFRAAADLGFVWVETDVNTTSDGVVLAFHDPTLDRVTNTSGDSEDRRRRTLENIARLTGKRPLTSAGTIGCAGLTILSKTARVTDKASPRIASLIWSLLTKAWAVKVADFTAVQLPVTYDLSLPGGRKLPVSVVDPKFVEVAHRVGVAVHVWTINDADEMRQLLDIGADGIVTDRGDVLTRVLADRGQWPSHSA